MAFLSNEEKFFWAKNLPSTECISPGFYIPQTIHRKMKNSFVPFGSGVDKSTKVEFNNIPLNHSKNIYFLIQRKEDFQISKKTHIIRKK
jgi:hypothetical protein